MIERKSYCEYCGYIVDGNGFQIIDVGGKEPKYAHVCKECFKKHHNGIERIERNVKDNKIRRSY